ncbi:hypothetical protein PV327_007618 [Microctonus hyperodae]|uniref:Uncharacterized protein n=1 Tax=Microctonus hyperodae TaxID=165561 RepID=A0AA39FZK1_MICHY|nr:hypothetical protein PV327_007618 [Microctonus hyperodae]
MAFTTFQDRRFKSLLWSQRPRLPLPNPRSDELKLVRALLISGHGLADDDDNQDDNDDDDDDEEEGDVYRIEIMLRFHDSHVNFKLYSQASCARIWCLNPSGFNATTTYRSSSLSWWWVLKTLCTDGV